MITDLKDLMLTTCFFQTQIGEFVTDLTDNILAAGCAFRVFDIGFTICDHL